MNELSEAQRDELEAREIARAHAVRQILQDELFNEVLDTMERQWSEAWRLSEPAQTSLREELYRLLLVMGEIRERLAQIAETGKLAERARTDRTAAREVGGR